MVWSEGSYPVALPRDFNADFGSDSSAMIRRGIATPLVIGAMTYDAAHDDAFNSALCSTPAASRHGPLRQGTAARLRRVHAGHRVFSVVEKSPAGGRGTIHAGAGPALMPLQGPEGRNLVAADPVICYEDHLPGFLRRVASSHPNLLVNLTSDSWFGANSEPWEHLALAVFATVETARRDGSLGEFRRLGAHRSERPAAAKDLRGRSLPPAAPGRRHLVSAPRMDGGDTVYVKFGNWFAYLCIGRHGNGRVSRRTPHGSGQSSDESRYCLSRRYVGCQDSLSLQPHFLGGREVGSAHRAMSVVMSMVVGIFVVFVGERGFRSDRKTGARLQARTRKADGCPRRFRTGGA